MISTSPPTQTPDPPRNFESYKSICGLQSFAKDHARSDNKEPPEEVDSLDQTIPTFEDITDIRDNSERIDIVKTRYIAGSNGQRTDPLESHALLLRRVEDTENGQLFKWSQLEIQSPRLCNAFASLSKGLVTLRPHQRPIIIKSPYRELFHCRKRIYQTYEADTLLELKPELELLIKFEQEYMSQTVLEIKQLKAQRCIEFDYLWALFPPGELVVIQSPGLNSQITPWFATVKEFGTIAKTLKGPVWWITVLHTGFDGADLGKVETTFTFPHFTEKDRPINRLQVYPFRYCENGENMRSMAIDQGRVYERCCLSSSRSSEPPAGSSWHHVGPVWAWREDQEHNKEDTVGVSRYDCPSSRTAAAHFFNDPSTTNTGRVIVDFEGFYREASSFREKLTAKSDVPVITIGDQSPDNISRLSDDELLICPPMVPIYSLSTQQWSLALLGNLKEIEWQVDAWEKLQLLPSYKDLIWALTHGFSSRGASTFDDFVRDKGRGLVFLLHGTAGCGKTMTAETISEKLRKPLYVISGERLGPTSIETVENGLQKSFDHAARWGAILLLEEADIFMTRRRDSEIAQNSVATVLLRLLEYHPGIVILTTNRRKTDNNNNNNNLIDPAFESRIHLQIPFYGLTPDARRFIWTLLAKESCGCHLSEGQAGKLAAAAHDFNGRQIKNILRMAFLVRASKLQRERESGGDGEQVMVVVRVTYDDIEAVMAVASLSLSNW